MAGKKTSSSKRRSKGSKASSSGRRISEEAELPPTIRENLRSPDKRAGRSRKATGADQKRPRNSKKKKPKEEDEPKAKNFKDIDEEIDDEGEAGEQVVHVQCPSCRYLFEDRDGICPKCSYDITTRPASEETKEVNVHGRFFPIYIAEAICVFLALFIVYFIAAPELNVEYDGDMTTFIGAYFAELLLMAFGAALLTLVALLFLLLKRQKLSPPLKRGLIITGLASAAFSLLSFGGSKPLVILVPVVSQGDWERDAIGAHTVMIILGLLSLVILALYLYLVLRPQKDQEE